MTQVTDWWKSSYRFAKTMEEQYPGAAGCAMRLREETGEFRQHLPVIQSLASPALKPRHWEELSKRIGQEIEPDEDLTLKGLLEMNVGDYIESIQEVSHTSHPQTFEGCTDY
jgi:dynein heavy chain, axonemal